MASSSSISTSLSGSETREEFNAFGQERTRLGDVGAIAEDRTVFITFSGGHPISEAEVYDYFTRRYGEIIETIIMPPDHVLYAKMVLRSADMLPVIISDDKQKNRHNINGKQARVRKYTQFLSEQRERTRPSNVGAIAEDRTVFITFSGGYPISEAEVYDYFTRRYGEIIETIIMPPDHVLYAKMVLRSADMLPMIISDDKQKNRHDINGKQARVRKYIQFLSEQRERTRPSNVGAIAEDRTVFITFSGGYPISEAEVYDYFTRRFGEIIETIIMPPEDPVLYAKMVLCSADMLPVIVSDDKQKNRHNINGKRARVQKYTHRN